MVSMCVTPLKSTCLLYIDPLILCFCWILLRITSQQRQMGSLPAGPIQAGAGKHLGSGKAAVSQHLPPFSVFLSPDVSPRTQHTFLPLQDTHLVGAGGNGREPRCHSFNSKNKVNKMSGVWAKGRLQGHLPILRDIIFLGSSSRPPNN